MFSPSKKLEKDDILANLMQVTDGPRVIGKPGPIAKTHRELLAEANAAADIEKECRERNLALGKALKN